MHAMPRVNLSFAVVSGALVLAGCGTQATAPEEPPSFTDTGALVEEGLQEFIGTRGDVFEGGCSDGFYEERGLALWRCVVFVGEDSQRWNVAVNDQGEVVDASAR